MLRLPWYKKWVSYIYPVVIERHKNDTHTNLKIKYFQGQIQLESESALYSDGHRYAPFKMAYTFLDKEGHLKSVKKFLLLGAGLGSALERLQKVYKLYPETYLVEYDPNILKLSRKYLLINQEENVHFIRQEALDFVKEAQEEFDLIGIDLFDALENSYLISDIAFWKHIKKITHPKTHLILNTIFLKKKELQEFENKISKDFTFVRLKRIPNYVYILKIKP